MDSMTDGLGVEEIHLVKMNFDFGNEVDERKDDRCWDWTFSSYGWYGD